MKRALSFQQAKERGLRHSDYSYENLPEEFIGTIEYKIWGKRTNLLLYVVSEEGERFLISLFSRNIS